MLGSTTFSASSICTYSAHAGRRHEATILHEERKEEKLLQARPYGSRSTVMKDSLTPVIILVLDLIVCSVTARTSPYSTLPMETLSFALSLSVRDHCKPHCSKASGEQIRVGPEVKCTAHTPLTAVGPIRCPQPLFYLTSSYVQSTLSTRLRLFRTEGNLKTIGMVRPQNACIPNLCCWTPARPPLV